ncbi:MAG TPA: hypothetical protein VGM37_08565 [Armatimonadota bacterium]|jgi:hypothetical protein
MTDLTTSEMAHELRKQMVAENISLRRTCQLRGWDYNAVYYRLTKDGWIVRATLVKLRQPAATQGNAMEGDER